MYGSISVYFRAQQTNANKKEFAMKKMKKIMLSMALLASLWTGSSINNRAEAGLMCMPFSYAGGFVVVISSFSYGLLTIGLTSADFIEEDHIMNRVGGIIFLEEFFLEKKIRLMREFRIY